MRRLYNVLKAEYGKCPEGCSVCEEACAQAAKDTHGTRLKALHLSTFHGLVKCNQCSDPACARMCPAGAISKSHADGVVSISDERCVGCGLCRLACTYGGIHYDRSSRKAYKCDNCAGDPACAKACPHGILSYVQSQRIRDYLGEDLMTPGAGTCIGCGLELTVRFTLKVLGKDVIVFRSAGCGAVAMGTMPQGAAVGVSTCVSLMTNVPAVATGAKRYLKRIGQDRTCVIIGGDGLTADVGFQSLSGAAERGEELLYLCMDNEAYMNTGIQRSSTTPFGGWTTTTPAGKGARGKDMPLIMAFHGIPYVATATMAYPEDYARKLLKAKAVKDGLTYIHVLSPCNMGWRAGEDSLIEVARLAVETDYFPLWERHERKLSFTYRPKHVRPLQEFTSLMGRFDNLSETQLEQLRQEIHERIRTLETLAGKEESCGGD